MKIEAFIDVVCMFLLNRELMAVPTGEAGYDAEKNFADGCVCSEDRIVLLEALLNTPRWRLKR